MSKVKFNLCQVSYANLGSARWIVTFHASRDPGGSRVLMLYNLWAWSSVLFSPFLLSLHCPEVRCWFFLRKPHYSVFWPSIGKTKFTLIIGGGRGKNHLPTLFFVNYLLAWFSPCFPSPWNGHEEENLLWINWVSVPSGDVLDTFLPD